MRVQVPYVGIAPDQVPVHTVDVKPLFGAAPPVIRIRNVQHILLLYAEGMPEADHTVCVRAHRHALVLG